MRKFLLALLIALFISKIARADEPLPLSDFSKTTADGQYIFVMLVQDLADGYNQGGIITDPQLRKTYPNSGLYSSTDPTQMLYSIDWNAFDVELSHNGQYLVRWGPWASSDGYTDIALEFYKNGKLLKSYRVLDLTNQFGQLEHTVSHYTWLKDHNLDQQNQQLTINLLSGEQYTFDLSTGQIVQGSTGNKIAQLGIGLFLLSSFWFVWHKRQHA
jgi:hypothetical protein